jgi:acetyl esterase/lipase
MLLIILICAAAMGEPTVNKPASTEPSAIIALLRGPAPGALGSDREKDVPTLSLFLPPATAATGAAMIICPGGAYQHLAPHEGKDYALWLNQLGIAGLVLKYRLGSAGYRYPVMLEDIQRAIRTARLRARQWNIDAGRIGVMGSSAGGHLASTAMTHFDAGQSDAADPIERIRSRPDLGVLCYPVITMGPLTHAGTKQNLLGDHPDPKLVENLSNELHVTADTPPCFIWATADDHTVPVQNSLLFAEALAAHKVPFEIHIYPHGPHGQGLGVHGYDPATTAPAALLPWTSELSHWLRIQHFAN